MPFRFLGIRDRLPLDIEAYLQSGDFGGTTWIMSPAMTIGGALVSGVLTPNQIYAWPFVLPYGGKIIRTQIRVTTLQAATNARVALYRAGGTGLRDIYPKHLVQEFTEFSVATTGVKADTTTVVRLAGGVLYWAAFNTNATTGAFRLFPSTTGKAISVWLTTGDVGTPPHGATVAQAYGAFPNPFPAGGTLSAANMPLIGFQLSR